MRKGDEGKKRLADTRQVMRGLDALAGFIVETVQTSGGGTCWLPGGCFTNKGRFIPPLEVRVRALLQGQSARLEHSYERARAEDDRKLLHTAWWVQIMTLCRQRPSEDSEALPMLAAILAAKESRKYYLSDDPWVSSRQADCIESTLSSPFGHVDEVHEELMALLECEWARFSFSNCTEGSSFAGRLCVRGLRSAAAEHALELAHVLRERCDHRPRAHRGQGLLEA